jgi:hypothetical protein
MALNQFPASPVPQRLPSGYATDPPYGPLADSGFGNPFFYHQFADDFDNALNTGATGLYTITSSGAGGTPGVTHIGGDGGIAQFLTATAANAFESIQLPAGSFVLPGTGATPPSSSTSAKKLFWLARVQLNTSVTTQSFIAGLVSITTTPFTTGVQSVTDGLFFYKAAGGTQLQVINVGSAGNSPSGAGFTNTFNIPPASYSLVAGTSIDLAFYIDRSQNLRMYVGSQLVGWIPQSGSGAVNAAGVPILPSLGPVLANYNYQAQGVTPTGASFVNPILFTTANLSPTLAFSNGVTAAAATALVDFHMAQKER